MRFILTFCTNHPLSNCYAVVEADTYASARSKVAATYSAKWAFLYDNEEKAGVAKFDLREVPFGTPNE